MRFLLLSAFAALILVAGLLYRRDHPPARSTPREAAPPVEVATAPAPLPDVAAAARRRAPASRETQAELARFVLRCAERGAAAVPELQARLRAGEDRRLLDRWRFVDGRPDGFPTLRAAYLEALRAIAGPESGAALADALAATDSPFETYQIASALHARRTGGWLAPLLDRATAGETSPEVLPVRRLAVALAAEADPGAVGERLRAAAPRGDDPHDPQVLGHALRTMPLDAALAVAGPLLADAAVTRRARARYLHELAGREDLDVYPRLAALAARDGWDDLQRNEAAFSAVGATVFFDEAAAYHAALTAGDDAEAAHVRSRFEQRLEAVRRFAQDLLAIDLDHPRERRALSLARALENHRRRLE